jgi:DNA polymerase III sliding clamp (beta) subunit (PCNA family)
MERERTQVQAVKKYPDISRVIKQKEEHRRLLAALSFEQKIELVFKLNDRRKFIKSGKAVSKPSLDKP